MKSKIICLSMVAALVVAFELRAEPAPQKNSAWLQGTWQLVSFKHGAQAKFSTLPEGRRRLKLITETHYSWVEFDSAKKKVKSEAGGTWTLKGETYTETIAWVDSSIASYLGDQRSFTLKMDGDKFHQSGALANGMQIEEVWQRVKP